MSNLPDDVFVLMLTTWCDARVLGKLTCSAQRCRRWAADATKRLAAAPGKYHEKFVALPMAGFGTVGFNRYTATPPDTAATKPVPDLRIVSRDLCLQVSQSRGLPFCNRHPWRSAVANSVRHRCSLAVGADLNYNTGRWSLTVVAAAWCDKDEVKVTILGDEMDIVSFVQLHTCSSHPDFVFIDILASSARGLRRYCYRCERNGAQGLVVTCLSRFLYAHRSLVNLPIDPSLDLSLRIGHVGYLLGLYRYDVCITNTNVVAISPHNSEKHFKAACDSAKCIISGQFNRQLDGDNGRIEYIEGVLPVPRCFFRLTDDVGTRPVCAVFQGSDITLLSVILYHHSTCRCGITCSQHLYLMPIDPLNGRPLTHLALHTPDRFPEQVLCAFWGDDQYERGSSWYVGVIEKGPEDRFHLYRNDYGLVYCAALKSVLNWK